MTRKILSGLCMITVLLATACGDATKEQNAGKIAPTATPKVVEIQTQQPFINYPESGIALDCQPVGEVTISEETLRSGEKEMVAKGRKKARDGFKIDLTSYVEKGKQYDVSAVMSYTIEESTFDTLMCDAVLTDADGNEEVVELTYEPIMSYRKGIVDRYFDVGQAEKVELYWHMQECKTADIHLQSLQVTEVKTGAEAVLAIDSLAQTASKYGFNMGTVTNVYNYEDEMFQSIIAKHFNTLSTGNEMKAYSLLNQGDCIRSAKEGNGEPKMKFTVADEMVQFASDNGIKVRGHCLVWDAYMCDWFFNEGYQNGAPKVSKEVMKMRLESYIKQVVEHFDTKFPGVVYCWDVVNEGVGDTTGMDCREEDPCHIRTMREEEVNPFYEYVGEDYIKLSFQYARKYAAPTTKLFYNDYNTYYPEKRAAIVELVKELNKEEKLIDGVGMQGYINMDEGLLKSSGGDGTSLVDSVTAFSDAGVEVHFTEMTVKNYDKMLNNEHGAYYGKLFDAIKELNKDKTRVTNVSIWGLCDTPEEVEGSYVYSLQGTYYGILDRNYQPKPAFAEIFNSLSR